MRFSTYSLAVWGVGLLGFGDGGCVLWGCFGFGKKLFGAAYHLHEVSNRVKVGSSWQWWVVDLLSYFVIFFETLVE